MTTISFSQSISAEGKIVLTLSSADLPANGFTFSMDLNYAGPTVAYDALSFSGAASANISTSSTGGGGSVHVSASVTPAPGGSFATMVFDASSGGVFDATIAGLKINGVTPVFSDPAPFSYSTNAVGFQVGVKQGETVSGSYDPLDSFFSPTSEFTTLPGHGSVTIPNPAAPTKWSYTPAAGFYGADTFTMKVSDAFDSKSQTFKVNVSPVGTAANDTFHSSAANYTVDGGAGIDAIHYQGASANFAIAASGSGFVVTDNTGAEGINTLVNVERLQFADQTIALDIGGNAGQAYRVYQAAFNRAPDSAGLGYWIGNMDHGASLKDVAVGFVHSKEFSDVYGSAPGNADIVNHFYQNVLHRAGETAGVNYWTGLLDSKAASVADVLMGFSESAENQAALATLIGHGIAYTPFG
jgi:hypothetical protein